MSYRTKPRLSDTAQGQAGAFHPWIFMQSDRMIVDI